jgi:transcriptional regulator with XRE-family HTH domain
MMAGVRTFREVAQKAGCSEAYLSQVETGRASPSFPSLKRIAAGYGVSIVELFAEPDHPEGHQIVRRQPERRRLTMGNPHVTKELLVARQTGKRMEPLRVTIAPQSGSPGWVAPRSRRASAGPRGLDLCADPRTRARR